MSIEVTQVELSADLYSDKYEKIGLDWSPDGELHEEMLTRLNALARESRSAMQPRYKNWARIDRNLTGFMPMDEEEYIEKQLDDRKPITVVVPMTFVAREAILTYLTGTFLDRDVYFPIDGVGPEDTLGTLLLQHVLHQQAIRGDAELALHTQWSDSITYGIGILAPHWIREEAQESVEIPIGFTDPITGEFIQTGTEQELRNELTWEGHKFLNIDPYLYLPDPSVPPQRMQEGEFIGWMTKSNYLNLLSDENTDSDMFNVKFLAGRHERSSLSQREDGRSDREDASQVDRVASARPVDLLVMFRKVIPKEENLGDSELPEKWLFVVANDTIIIKAMKLELNHNLFPVTVCAPDYDGYTNSPTSRLEMIFGLQQTIDWFLTSHIANVRKAVNDTFVVDPFRINVQDIESRKNKAGGVIRLRRSSWGSGVKDAIEQLKVFDVTRGHMSDIQSLTGWVEQVTGASESLQGIFGDAPERRTAQEFTQTHSNATGRLAKYARLTHAMSIRPLTHIMASQTIQLMENDTYIKLTGEMAQNLAREYGLEEEIINGRIKVSPGQLSSNYDVVPSDGRPIADVGSQEIFQLMQIGLSNPQILARFDMPRLWASAVRKAGEKNISDFEIQISVQDEETIRSATARGEMKGVGSNA